MTEGRETRRDQHLSLIARDVSLLSRVPDPVAALLSCSLEAEDQIELINGISSAPFPLERSWRID